MIQCKGALCIIDGHYSLAMHAQACEVGLRHEHWSCISMAFTATVLGTFRNMKKSKALRNDASRASPPTLPQQLHCLSLSSHQVWVCVVGGQGLSLSIASHETTWSACLQRSFKLIRSVASKAPVRVPELTKGSRTRNRSKICSVMGSSMPDVPMIGSYYAGVDSIIILSHCRR